jgi:hypothetical protein
MSLTEELSPPAAPASAEPRPIGQALLFSPEIERRIEEEESRGIYTAERALEKRPGLKEAVIQLRAAGEGYLSIASKLNCHHRTASAIAVRFAESVDIERAKRVGRLRSAADKLVELLDNSPESVPPQMRALAASQLYDKAELLDGRATSRVEKMERVDLFSNWEEFVQKNLEPGPSEKQLDAGDVKEIEAEPPPRPSRIGLVGGNVSAIDAASSTADRQPDEAASDVESLVSSPVTQVATTDATGSDTDHDHQALPIAEGGGGDAGASRGAIQPIHKEHRKFYSNEFPPTPPPV